jgi:hypothetical protein
MTDYDRILRRIAESPEAREQLTCALVYAEHGNWDLARLHSAAAADILVNRNPELGDPLRVAAIFTAAFLQDERNRTRALLN